MPRARRRLAAQGRIAVEGRRSRLPRASGRQRGACREVHEAERRLPVGWESTPPVYWRKQWRGILRRAISTVEEQISICRQADEPTGQQSDGPILLPARAFAASANTPWRPARPDGARDCSFSCRLCPDVASVRGCFVGATATPPPLEKTSRTAKGREGPLRYPPSWSYV